VPALGTVGSSPKSLGGFVLTDDIKIGNELASDIVLEPQAATARLYGRIEIDSSPEIRCRLLAFLRTPSSTVVKIDMSAVTHIDSSGIATLIEALRAAHESGTELRLHGLHDRLLRLFASTGILALFNGDVLTHKSRTETI